MAIVTNIQTMIDRQTAVNTSRTKPLEDAIEHHKEHDPEFTVDGLSKSVDGKSGHRSGGSICGCCDSPMVSVISIISGEAIRLCREVHSARKLASLCFHNSSLIAYHSKLVLAEDGVVGGQVKLEIAPADLQVYIDEGRVEIDDETDNTLLHDIVHASDKHCRGCIWLREPGCIKTGGCPDFVESPSRLE